MNKETKKSIMVIAEAVTGLITPEDAKRLLDMNPKRTVRKKVVKKLTKDMKDEKFKYLK